MTKNRLLHRTARILRRGGFTLVELLVVIGIIAILAGVALGPITAGIKKAQQSSGVQTARTIGLAEFSYANDNSQTWPTGADVSKIAVALIAGNYISDATIFYIGGSTNEQKFTGTTGTAIAVNNISYDFTVVSQSVGINANAPDQLPIVLSSSGSPTALSYPTAGGALSATVIPANPFGTAGVAVSYKSNSAKFITSTGSGTTYTAPIVDASFPGYTAITLPGNG